MDTTRVQLLARMSIVLVLLVLVAPVSCAAPAAPPEATPTTPPTVAPTVAPTEPPPAEEPKELVAGWAGIPGHINPVLMDILPGMAMLSHVYEPLWFREYVNGEMKIKPLLAESWEQIEPTRIRYHLREGVTFCDGEPFNADSVKYSIERMIDPENPSYSRTFVATIDHVEIVDEYTVDVVTSVPDRSVNSQIPVILMLPPRWAEEIGEGIAAEACGTGAYNFVDFAPDDHMTVEANPNWWDIENRGNIERITFRFMPEAATRAAALEAGEAQFIMNVPPDSIDRIKASPDLDVLSTPSTRICFLAPMFDRAPTNDLRVRQAMQYAIDRQEIVDTLMPEGQVANAPLAPSMWTAAKDLTPYSYDPDKARALLADYGEPVTIKLGCAVGRYLNDSQVCQAIGGYLEAVGITVELDAPEWGTYLANVRAGHDSPYDAYMLCWANSTGEPDFQFSANYLTSAATNFYTNDRVDELIGLGKGAFENEPVEEYYHEIQEIVWNDLTWIYLYYMATIEGVNTVHFSDHEVRPDEFAVFMYESLD